MTDLKKILIGLAITVLTGMGAGFVKHEAELSRSAEAIQNIKEDMQDVRESQREILELLRGP